MSRLILKKVDYLEGQTAIKAVRIQVFQVEQGVAPSLEFDGEDQAAKHILAYLDNQPIGTVRIRYLDNQTAKIERLAVLSHARGQGIGKQLMEKAVEIAANQGIKEVVIHAQEYVQSLYQKLGFTLEGERFDEAGIPHVKMRKKLG
ncbi:GNAT family N-acetyltransferase [Lyngbya aestuarii]|uniref:GNAT family N-acetyltransferase n=1 Tax=Lyngbya aestuarii TaxID=118322 RepID=UPI00403DB6A5